MSNFKIVWHLGNVEIATYVRYLHLPNCLSLYTRKDFCIITLTCELLRRILIELALYCMYEISKDFECITILGKWCVHMQHVYYDHLSAAYTSLSQIWLRF